MDYLDKLIITKGGVSSYCRQGISSECRLTEAAHPPPNEIEGARKLMKQADPEGIRLAALAHGAVKRYLLSDVPKEFWPSQFVAGGRR